MKCDVTIKLKQFPSIPRFLRVFIMNECVLVYLLFQPQFNHLNFYCFNVSLPNFYDTISSHVRNQEDVTFLQCKPTLPLFSEK